MIRCWQIWSMTFIMRLSVKLELNIRWTKPKLGQTTSKLCLTVIQCKIWRTCAKYGNMKMMKVKWLISPIYSACKSTLGIMNFSSIRQSSLKKDTLRWRVGSFLTSFSWFQKKERFKERYLKSSHISGCVSRAKAEFAPWVKVSRLDPEIMIKTVYNGWPKIM